MKRRTYLISSATLVATTGCLNQATDTGPDESGDGGTDTPTDTPADSDDDADDNIDGTPRPSEVSVRNSTVQPAWVELAVDSIGVYGNAGQYLVVYASHEDGPVPDRSAFTLTVDGTEYDAEADIRGLWIDGDYGVEYRGDEGTGWLVFGVPASVTADAAAVTWPGGEWTVPAAVRDRLATPPASFDVSFAAPDSVAEGETPTLTMSVTNTAEVAGRFVFALNRVGPDVAYTPVRSGVIDLAAGETVSKEWKGESPTADRDVTYHFRTKNHDRSSRTITLEG